MGKFTIKQLADAAGVSTDTLFKARRGVSTPRPALAKKLEEITGVDRDKWMYPNEMGSAWEELDLVVIRSIPKKCIECDLWQANQKKAADEES